MPGLPAFGVILAALLGLAQVSPTIPYTVQVIIASDQSTALSLQTELRLEGFPVYVVRASTGQGDLYRVRVGAFANRDAALSYAGRMPPLGGSKPVPILSGVDSPEDHSPRHSAPRGAPSRGG
ncbi:MAG: SPOR domain-containing protein [Truepera sp.]|nr:SPOR domain-containing protein [Truepera sp.]